MKYSVVTTFNQSGYEKYGRRMVETFLANWPQKIKLYVYSEDCNITQTHERLVVYDFHKKVPALVKFKQRWGNDPRARGQLAMGPPDKKGKQPGIGFRWDAIRFSHKVYAVCDHAKASDNQVIIWMDADMVCHSSIDLDFVASQIPSRVGIAYLGRARKFSECGLYALNLEHAPTHSFVEQFQNAYDDAENGIWTMDEWNDCWVFDRIRERTQKQYPNWNQLNWSENFPKQGEGHPLINTAWGRYLDHLKGTRKDLGRSKSQDLLHPIDHAYWR